MSLLTRVVSTGKSVGRSYVHVLQILIFNNTYTLRLEIGIQFICVQQNGEETPHTDKKYDQVMPWASNL